MLDSRESASSFAPVSPIPLQARFSSVRDPQSISGTARAVAPSQPRRLRLRSRDVRLLHCSAACTTAAAASDFSMLLLRSTLRRLLHNRMAIASRTPSLSSISLERRLSFVSNRLRAMAPASVGTAPGLVPSVSSGPPCLWPGGGLGSKSSSSTACGASHSSRRSSSSCRGRVSAGKAFVGSITVSSRRIGSATAPSSTLACSSCTRSASASSTCSSPSAASSPAPAADAGTALAPRRSLKERRNSTWSSSDTWSDRRDSATAWMLPKLARTCTIRLMCRHPRACFLRSQRQTPRFPSAATAARPPCKSLAVSPRRNQSAASGSCPPAPASGAQPGDDSAEPPLEFWDAIIPSRLVPGLLATACW
mmetsp:Transcript_47237/g.127481  ORF Transcript_47237/g.127481 Transcript_47237/m.127481 type:complete len:365 (+) Transcript_47237:1357-2451(+)